LVSRHRRRHSGSRSRRRVLGFSRRRHVLGGRRRRVPPSSEQQPVVDNVAGGAFAVASAVDCVAVAVRGSRIIRKERAGGEEEEVVRRLVLAALSSDAAIARCSSAATVRASQTLAVVRGSVRRD
jgi:hypothetical protein